jgi:hypothetical protein
MTILAPVVVPSASVHVEGNVANGCHSRSGLDDMDRQENLWMGCGNERRMAWVESACAVKVQRRRRSQGYMRRRVMRVRVQEVGERTSRVMCGVEVGWDVW